MFTLNSELTLLAAPLPAALDAAAAGPLPVPAPPSLPGSSLTVTRPAPACDAKRAWIRCLAASASAAGVGSIAFSAAGVQEWAGVGVMGKPCAVHLLPCLCVSRVYSRALMAKRFILMALVCWFAGKTVFAAQPEPSPPTPAPSAKAITFAWFSAAGCSSSVQVMQDTRPVRHNSNLPNALPLALRAVFQLTRCLPCTRSSRTASAMPSPMACTRRRP